MKTEQLVEIIGDVIEDAVIAGRCGNAVLTSRGYLVCDPCYVSPSFDKAVNPFTNPNVPKEHEWVGFDFNGTAAFSRMSGDGFGPFGLSIDSGQLVAVQWDALAESDRVRLAACFDAELEAIR